MARYLIVNADDFGLTAGVSRGILRAHREGILTSTTFMVNFPWSEQMAPMLSEAPNLGVGIHLNLTTGTPILPPAQVPSLVNAQGRFVRSVFHLRFRVDLAQARAEWSAQVERGIALLGRRPTHLDSHRYLQAHPGFAEVMLEIARTYQIPAVRCLYPDLVPPGRMQSINPAMLLLGRYLKRSAQMVRESDRRSPAATMAGDFDLQGLLAKLAHVHDGVTELVCHPGEVDEQLPSLSSLVAQREVELAALTALDARRRVDELGIELVSFAHFAD